MDAAEVMLRLESARLHGLVIGAPRANFGRCLEILELGVARRFEPAKDAAELLLGEFLGSPAGLPK